jgi:shikimate kinase
MGLRRQWRSMTAWCKALVSMLQPLSSVRADAPAERLTSKTVNPELRTRTIVLVGLMGVGKTTVGRGLAAALDLPFRDSDEEVERAAGRSVADIFTERGEAEFRDGERRVIARLVNQEPVHVLALGGGAFVHPQTRAFLKANTRSVWLKAEISVIARRVARRNTRPLLVGKDPVTVLTGLAQARYPLYGEADLTVELGETSSAASVAAVIDALAAHLSPPAGETA